jgi:Kyakuja-Dileera-Zisupton transposase
MPEYPEYMQIDLDCVEVRTAVPSFHICAHGTDCQQLFSFAFLLWVTRTVGEEVETGWAHMNLTSSSIQEMGPGHWHEALNDHWGGWNFQKTITFRT